MRLEPSVGNIEKPEVSSSSQQPRLNSSFPDFPDERAELEWVLSHPEISRSANLVRFLSFICNKYFDGDSKDIREHTIATEALGRKPSNFDSHADPIVRVTARTLRKKLQNLYQTDGRSHRLQIMLPLGHYKPEFVYRTDAELEAAAPTEAPTNEEASSDTLVHEAPATDATEETTEPQAPGRFVWQSVAKPLVLTLAVAVIFLSGFLVGRHTNESSRPAVAFQWGNPTWSDEFDGAAQQLPDATKWTYDLEDQGGIGENDHQVYCSPRESTSRKCDPHHPNAFLDGKGNLDLRAQKNSSGVWTLVRITTKGLKNFQYGRIEARMKLPVGTGLWPSFFIVGANKDSVGWPASGSADIVENVSVTPGNNGLGPTMIRSTLHGPRYFGSNGLWHDFKLPNGGRVDDDSFHIYGIIWSPGMIQFYVDDPANVYMVHNNTDLPEGGVWVFDHPFYLMMNLAVGGYWAGDPDATTPNPADILVDYVRAYKIPTVAAPKIEWEPVPVKAGSSAASTISLHASSYSGRVHLSCSTDSPTVACSLATSVLNFSDTLLQEDALTISTNLFTEKGRTVTPPGRYKLTIMATTISGDHSQLTMPFEVKNDE